MFRKNAFSSILCFMEAQDLSVAEGPKEVANTL